MAVASIALPIGGATLPDGSSGNAAPQIERLQGTETNPKKHVLVARFDPTTEEFLYWSFRLPDDANASPTFNLKMHVASIAAITTTNVVMGGRILAVTPADTDTPIEHAPPAQQTVTIANNTTEAGRLLTGTIAFTNAQADGAVAGDWLAIAVSRVAANGSDTLAEDCRLYAVTMEYLLA